MIDCPYCKTKGVTVGFQAIIVGGTCGEREVEHGCEKCGGGGLRAGKDSLGFVKGSGKLNCAFTIGEAVCVPGLEVLNIHPQRDGTCSVEVGYCDKLTGATIHLLTVDSEVLAKA